MPQGTQLDGGRFLAKLRADDPLTGEMIQQVIDAINRLSINVSASPQGELPPPPPVDSTSVKGSLANNVLTAPGEILHFVHTHNVPLNRGIQYITEISPNDPYFTAPHPLDHGASRSGIIHLPANDDSGHLVSYYLRVVAQYHGSGPSQPTVFGGLKNPTAIQMTGSTNMSLLSSQAAGTARPGQGGQGIGAVRSRGPVGGPKRQLS